MRSKFHRSDLEIPFFLLSRTSVDSGDHRLINFFLDRFTQLSVLFVFFFFSTLFFFSLLIHTRVGIRTHEYAREKGETRVEREIVISVIEVALYFPTSIVFLRTY